jgi:hypothetical protein
MLYFSENFDKSENNIIYAEPEKVLQYLTLTLWANHYSGPMRKNHLFLIEKLFLAKGALTAHLQICKCVEAQRRGEEIRSAFL